jgi:hypothetical protein
MAESAFNARRIDTVVSTPHEQGIGIQELAIADRIQWKIGTNITHLTIGRG